MNFTDSIIDPQTGTVSVRATLPNANSRLIPGQFVRVRMLLERLEDVFLVDPAAVGEGPEGPRIFVVRDNSTVEARPVRLGPVVEGRQVVRDGLQRGDRIVVNGHVALQEGMTVAAQPAGEGEG